MTCGRELTKSLLFRNHVQSWSSFEQSAVLIMAFSPLEKSCESGDRAGFQALLPLDAATVNNVSANKLYNMARGAMYTQPAIQNDGDHYTLLQIACSSSDRKLEIVQTIVAAGGSILQTTPDSAWTSLHFAAYRYGKFGKEADMLAIVRFLLLTLEAQAVARGEDGKAARAAALKLRTAEGFTPLFLACMSRTMSLVKYLVEEEYADVHDSDRKGNSLLHAAVGYGTQVSMELVEYLTKYMDINVRNKNGKTPLFQCTRSKCEHLQDMIKLGADPLCKDNKNR